MEVKCLAQENYAVLQPELEPRPLFQEFSVLPIRPPYLPINASKHIFNTQPYLFSLVGFSLLSTGLRERLLLWDLERDLDFLSSFDCERPLKAKIFNI